jgi:hypothetical protein
MVDRRIIGPVVVNYIRRRSWPLACRAITLQHHHVHPGAMLIIGLVCNYLIRPVDAKWHMSAEAVARLQAASANSAAAAQSGSFGIGKGGLDAEAALFWALVGVPLAWGVWKTLESAVKIF